MRRFAFAASLVLATLALHAQAASETRNGLLIKTSFTYESEGKSSKSESSFILDEQNKAWTNLVPPKNGVALLGRMVSKSAGNLHMEYIVVDTTKGNSVISTPAIVAMLGEPAEVGMTAPNGPTIAVGLLATPTTYVKVE